MTSISEEDGALIRLYDPSCLGPTRQYWQKIHSLYLWFILDYIWKNIQEKHKTGGCP